MSLFASLNLARLALGAQQTAIQTVGQNIANATTEGYARQRVQMTPTPSDDRVFARVGTGVQIERIERIVDEHLESTLRGATSDLGLLEERVQILTQAETVFNDLQGGGLSEAFALFFEALQDLANNPEDATTRAQMLVQAETLTNTMNFIDDRVRTLRESIDEDIVATAQNVNRLTTVIAELNREIVTAEDGGVHENTANDLRTRRDAALGELSELVAISVIPERGGSVQVVNGSQVLVHGRHANTLELRPASDGDISLHSLRLSEDGQRFAPSGGRLGALLDGRDRLAPEIRGEIDALATGLLREFNAVHAGGEGLTRYTQLTSTRAVADRNAPLDEAGLPFPIEDGRFQFQVVNEGDGSRETTVIDIELGGPGSETTLADLAAAINGQVGAAHPELQAAVTADGRLQISSSSESTSFTFRADDSGVLTALGLGTFFDGTNARDLRVVDRIAQDPSLIAAGLGGGPGDNGNALALVALRDAEVVGSQNRTFEGHYQAFVGALGVEGAEARQLYLEQEAIQLSARNQREALSGVSIDEEAISLIQHQRAYQGAARFLDVVDRLLETLISSV